QQHHVTNLPDVGELRAPAWVPREMAVADKPRGTRVAHEERGDDQLQLVDEVAGQKLGVNCPATFDHQTPYAALAEVLRVAAHLDVHAGGHLGRPPSKLGEGR